MMASGVPARASRAQPIAGIVNLAMEMFKFTAGIDLLHVSFRGRRAASRGD